MNHLPEDIDGLRQHIETLDRRLEQLESRVDALEHPLAARWPHSSVEPEAALAAATQAGESHAQAGSLFPVLGKALLGIAGAYVLRAVEETSAAPRLIVAAGGIETGFLGYGIGVRIPAKFGIVTLEWARNIDDGSSLGRINVGAGNE